MVAEMLENIRREGIIGYSKYPPFHCAVFLKGEKYSECCCKLEAKDQLFSLVNLIGFRREDVKVIDLETDEEVLL